MSDDDLCRMSATEILPHLRSGDISSARYMRAVLDRIERLDGATNGIANVNPEAAMAEAAARDAALASGEAPGALQGIPITAKDLLNMKGLPVESGSLAHKGLMAQDDIEAIARLRRMGALPFAKTATPEFGHKVLTDSPINGISRNPWDLSRSCGGSSGGTGIAAAMGFGPIHLSSDGAGSGRIPASACGVAGLKSTWGLIPHESTTDVFGSFTVIGVMGRTIADLALGLNGMKGTDRRDPWTYGSPKEPITIAADPLKALKGLRVRVILRTVNDWLDPEVEAAVLNAVGALTDAGAQQVSMIDDPVYDIASALTYMRAYQFARFGHVMADQADLLDRTARMSLTPTPAHTYEALAMALRARTDIFHEVERLLDGADIYITPTVTTPSLSADQAQDAPLIVDGVEHGLLRESWYPYTVPQNASGHPAMSVPVGMSSKGIPIGMQIVGPWHSESTLLSVAAAVEKLMPWADRWPPAAG